MGFSSHHLYHLCGDLPEPAGLVGFGELDDGPLPLFTTCLGNPRAGPFSYKSAGFAKPQQLVVLANVRLHCHDLNSNNRELL